MTRRTAAALLLLFTLGTPACAAGKDACEPLVDLVRFTPTELLLIMQGDPSAVMRLITNDNTAGDAFLRTKSLRVKRNDPAAGHLISRMLETVKQAKGVGIAAPQVGINRRAILVQRIDLEPEKPFRAYFNPKIVEMSDETLEDWEGCLSIPAGFGRVKRARSIVLTYEQEDAASAEETVTGFTARIFQHEIDHLDGILFIDRMEPGELMPEDEYRQMRAKEKSTADDA